MKVNKLGNLHLINEIAVQDGFVLKDKHAVTFLYCCSDLGANIDCNIEVDGLICELIMEFTQNPSIVLLELESYAKINFKKLAVFTKDW